jgi:hypothetical protein
MNSRHEHGEAIQPHAARHGKRKFAKTRELIAPSATRVARWRNPSQPQRSLTRVAKVRGICVHPGDPLIPIGLGQYARTTGGAGILPAAILQRVSVVLITDHEFQPWHPLWMHAAIHG